MATTEENRKQGKSNRARGTLFEKKVREDLLEQGYFVDKWGNNLVNGEIKASKPFFIGGRIINNTSGFPDFIAYRTVKNKRNGRQLYEVLGVECKINGILTEKERLAIKYYEKNEVFTRIIIAKQEKVGRRNIIIYQNATKTDADQEKNY